jgi:phage tail sheath protein FI
MLVPGVYDSAVTNRLINTCERRKDALAIIDLQSDYVPTTEGTDSASTRRGNVDDAVRNLKNRNLNTSYACAFYPAVQISDNLSAGERVWVPASIAGLGAMAQSEARSELWFAPAGFNRGGLGNLGGLSGPRVTQARQRLDSGERDNLYEVNINPIATFPNEGVVIFGQKTLQVTPSALDRINVRRLLLYLKSKVNHISRNLLFDQNVSSTWARFTSQVEPILSDVQARFGITEYKLILDETTTTPDLIDRNIMYAKIFLKPARAIEYIVVDFIITRTGADFA